MKDIAKGAVYIGIFAIPFIPLIISNSMFFPFITGKNFAFRIIAEVIFAAWIILALYEPKYRPRFSWILGAFASLLGVMAVANALGVDPRMSFWSNFERMEGYVTLVHAFLYFLVAGSVLTTDKLWDRFFNTTFLAAVMLALYAFAQLSGNITINQGGWRLDGTLGNSAYMAIYMLFHVFLGIWMFVRTKSTNLRYVYGALTLLFIYLLVQTATRGTILGLVGGLGVTTAYIALFTKDRPTIRKVAAGTLAALALFVALFITFKDSAFIQGNPYLQRVASINMGEGNVRFKVWNMAYTGFKEHPLLGWGQSNFSYVFNQNYDPSIYFAEAWYDRVHNIVFDWLVAGGVLGALAYFAIYFSALYYLVIRPFREAKESFTVTERGVLLGLLAGYLFHNLFVFDNIVSYTFYATILALIHSRVGKELPSIALPKFDVRVVEQVVAPIAGVALVATIYFVNVPGIRAATDIIDGFSAANPETMLSEFDDALARKSFGDQEIREQMTRQAQNVFTSDKAPEELKQRFFKRVEQELLKAVAEKPNDARVHVFIASFYRMTKNYEFAIKELEIARTLSPKKQQIIFEQGFTYLQKEEYSTALSYFKEAYELETTNTEAAVYYAASAIYAGQLGLVNELINTPARKQYFAQNDLAVSAARDAKMYDLLEEMFKKRIELTPTDPQMRVNLAYVLNESGKTGEAIEVLTKAGEDIPSFKEQAQNFIKSLVANKLPGAKPTATVNGQPVEVR